MEREGAKATAPAEKRARKVDTLDNNMVGFDFVGVATLCYHSAISTSTATHVKVSLPSLSGSFLSSFWESLTSALLSIEPAL